MALTIWGMGVNANTLELEQNHVLIPPLLLPSSAYETRHGRRGSCRLGVDKTGSGKAGNNHDVLYVLLCLLHEHRTSLISQGVSTLSIKNIECSYAFQACPSPTSLSVWTCGRHPASFASRTAQNQMDISTKPAPRQTPARIQEARVHQLGVQQCAAEATAEAPNPYLRPRSDEEGLGRRA